MKLSDFDFHLPEGHIALEPSPERDGSRLLVLRRKGGMEHRRFSDLPEYLNEGDLLVLNETMVLPLRLILKKPTGGRLDVILEKRLSPAGWEIISRKKYTGRVVLSDGSGAEVFDGKRIVFDTPPDIDGVGLMPLPPYIKRDPVMSDRERYQTVYAKEEGSIAAPTAGLHFTQGLIDKVSSKGVRISRLTLHVGRGTFVPIRCERLEDHEMAAEPFSINNETLDAVRHAKSSGGRVVAVGTTVTRALEGCMGGKYVRSPESNGRVCGSTDIFIRPGHRFMAVDALLTNFHLPRSTPLALASAFCGRERLLRAYEAAVEMNYRFFSYGDAMLIV